MPSRQEENESADKPGSVVGNHSSGSCVTAVLKQPTRIQCGPHRWIPIWPCSEWGLPCRYLLPVARCALTAPFHPYRPLAWLRRSTLCCTSRQLALPRCYLALCPVEPGLSSSCKTATRDCLADSSRSVSAAAQITSASSEIPRRGSESHRYHAAGPGFWGHQSQSSRSRPALRLQRHRA